MGTPFRKMHGLGNDFAIFDARATPVPLTPARVRLLADRRFGIGCDQLIRLEPSGNATRCVAQLLGGRATIETVAGLLHAEPDGADITVDMGAPRFDWEEIPLAYPVDTRDMPVAWGPLERPAAVNMGNPHVVFFVPDAAAIALDSLGPEIEHDPLFPERVNVNVVSRLAPDHLQLRVWERGAGLTLACGSGACATFAAARRRGLVGPAATISLPGGDLRISESGTGTLRMTGAVATSFTGETAL
jgi:diaminopimelate epimerase